MTTKRERELVKALTNLCADFEEFARWMDAEMVKPSTPDRGSRVALAMGAMERQKDMAKHFTLGLPLGKPIKRKGLPRADRIDRPRG